jgi:hypothetical protein
MPQPEPTARKFRKKPLVIEAEQFWPDKKPWPDGVFTHGDIGAPEWLIKTLEGWLRVSPGDWVITGVKGERYPCKPDIFEATYEQA